MEQISHGTKKGLKEGTVSRLQLKCFKRKIITFPNGTLLSFKKIHLLLENTFTDVPFPFSTSAPGTNLAKRQPYQEARLLQERRVPKHHVPRRVVDGRGEVHVQLVHRGLGGNSIA